MTYWNTLFCSQCLQGWVEESPTKIANTKLVGLQSLDPPLQNRTSSKPDKKTLPTESQRNRFASFTSCHFAWNAPMFTFCSILNS